MPHYYWFIDALELALTVYFWPKQITQYASLGLIYGAKSAWCGEGVMIGEVFLADFGFSNDFHRVPISGATLMGHEAKLLQMFASGETLSIAGEE